MRSAGSRQSRQASNWLPFSTDHYDRNPGLFSTEARALKSHAHEHHPAKPTLHDKVSRLIKPLEDLFGHTNLRHAVRPFLVLYLLREMTRRGRSFWGWTTVEWIETINNHPAQQQYLIATAYLLCGFTELDTVGWRHPLYVELAQKVFGQDRVERVLERVCTLLVERGYSWEGCDGATYREQCMRHYWSIVARISRTSRLKRSGKSRRTGSETRKDRKEPVLAPVFGWLLYLEC